MSYDFQIRRDEGISIEEWKRAVSSIPGLRLDDSPMTPRNPLTGETATIYGRDGDVAVLLDSEWVKVFHYFEGRVRFKGGLDDRDNPVATAALTLARILSARISGEEYR
jgi:hypothetical protein